MSRAWPEHTRVLVVEDDLPTARIIQTRLELEGLEVLLARNGLEAMDRLRKEDFQLITTDLMMPGMNGFRLVQEVRELPSPKGRIPILLISSNQNEQDMVRCLAAGADDYMIKPLSAQILVERLWRIFERSRREG
jgi:DNA-binding response OmpR family regulator